ncbi:hypothetical protein N7457_008176 [Penicillium paradoxum]|uniref:uncharacterized protein n=1 Tax=Penicillium paradoxum TaxID=176176 RepID=UPI002548B21A|nr:uncharacterized protein N7457_008176 [Penicillium paradoxum]KAJ5773280.1 hypothetical protein N7457_008176 [Penicillium paradoxum]
MSQSSELASPILSSHSAPVQFASTPSLFPSKAARVHHLRELKADLKKVATARGPVYTRKVAILVCWEDDDTGAKQDLITMSGVLEDFGIQCTNHMLRTADETPGWTLSHKIQQMLLDCAHSKLQSLFVFYYAGHGTIVDGKMSFVSNSKTVSWPSLYAIFTSEEDANVHVLTVLDCCHAAGATRSQTPRTIQIIAACDAEETTSPRPQKVSFTMRLFRAVQHFRGQSNVTTAALFQEIQRQKPRTTPSAIMETLSGTQPINLIFKDHTAPSRIPRLSSHTKAVHVLVKLTLHGQSQVPGHSELLPSFQTAIRELPANMQVDVMDAYETDQSVFFLMGLSWEAWSLWTMVAHFDFIGITLGPSLMDRHFVEFPVPTSGEDCPSHGRGNTE